MKHTKGQLVTFNPFIKRIEHLMRIPNVEPDFILPVCVGINPRVKRKYSRYAYINRYAERYTWDCDMCYLQPIHYIGRDRYRLPRLL